MNLNEAKEILQDNGYICEASQKEIVLLDTNPSKISIEDVRAWKDDDSIEEDSDEYYDAINDMIDADLDDFRSNAAFNFDLGPCLVDATAGLWNGTMEGTNIIDIDSGKDILNCLSKDCDNVKVVLNDDGLVMYGYHHDGTNTYTFYQLNSKGKEYWEKHEDDYNTNKTLKKLMNGKMVKKITKEMIGV